MPDYVAAYVSKQILGELLVKSSFISDPVKGNLSKDAIAKIVENNVINLKDFTFKNGLDIKTVVEDIRMGMEDSYDNTDLLSEAYRTARKAISKSSVHFINELAVKMSQTSLKVVAKLQNDIPEATETLFNKIHEQTVNKSKEHIVTNTTIDPANIFNWGKLSDISFLTRVKNHSDKAVNFFKRKNLGILDADKLATETSNITYPLASINKDVVKLITEQEMEHKEAVEEVLDLITNTDTHRKFRNAIKITFDSQFRSGRYNLPKFIQNLDNLFSGLESLNKVIISLENEDTDLIKDRATILESQLLMTYGACQVIRDYVMNDSLIVPIDNDLKSDTPPKGSKLYFNNDVRAKLSDIEEPEKEVTKIYNHYHRAGLKIGVEGLSVKQYIKIKDSINESVEDWVGRLQSESNQINFGIFKKTLSNVLKEDILNPVMESVEAGDKFKFLSIHDNKVEGMYFSIAHGTDIKDELLEYLVSMKQEPAVEALHQSVMESATEDLLPDLSDEDKPNAIYTNAYSKFIISFLRSEELIV